MSETPNSDELILKKWNPVSRFENFKNFSFLDMKGPSNISVRLDLFPEHKSIPNNMELHTNEKIKEDKNEISKWNETEQLNNQVVFINPEWDEIEEEKAGISSFVETMTPNISGDKLIPSQLTEFVVTDTESVSSVTVSLDEYTEESEEIVAVISDSEPDIIHTELFMQMEGLSEDKPKKFIESFSMQPEIHNGKYSANLKSISENEIADKILFKAENNKKYPVESIETSKLMKAGCYVMQNGKITKPFYIVKNPILREESVYKNINKTNEMNKKFLKSFNLVSRNEEESNLLSLSNGTMRKRENFRDHQVRKIEKNHDFIRIIENPSKSKRMVVNKMSDNKNYQDSTSRKLISDERGGFHKSLSSNSTNNTSEGEDLMWLLDFKLDDLFSESSLPALSHLDDSLEQYSEFPGKFVDVDGSVSNFSESDPDDKIKVEIGCQAETLTTKLNKPQSKYGYGKQPHKMDNSDTPLLNRTFSDLKCSENRKPPFTYTELIECALQEKGPLTVSEIYNWISETFPYYKSWDDRWKNSVRHNLSINPYFRKGTKARQGSGHLWTVNKTEDNSKINSWKRHRFHEFEEFSKRLRHNGETEKQGELLDCVSPSRILDETELATASIEDKENRRLHRDVLMAACVDNNFISATNVSLEQSAEEILSGVKKTVEVQYLEPVKPCENDFLNPISKEILMGECGLLNHIELNLTAENGEHLSIVDGMTDSEHIFGIPDELNFHYDMTTISHTPQLLPLAK